MSPIMVILLVVAVLIVIAFCFSVSAYILKKKNNRLEKEKLQDGSSICIHTREDCENCMVASKCVQRQGKGLLGFYKEE